MDLRGETEDVGGCRVGGEGEGEDGEQKFEREVEEGARVRHIYSMSNEMNVTSEVEPELGGCERQRARRSASSESG